MTEGVLRNRDDHQGPPLGDGVQISEAFVLAQEVSPSSNRPQNRSAITMIPGNTQRSFPLNSLAIFVMLDAARWRFIHQTGIRNEEVDSSILFSSTNKSPEANHYRRFHFGLSFHEGVVVLKTA